jgi:Domain of unknown function (DUF3303)
MRVMATWTLHEDKFLDVLKKWSSLTPAERADVGKGVKLVGRWHSPTEKRGVAIFETTDLAALEAYSGQWAPAMAITIVPVLNDEESAAAAKTILSAAH